MSQKSKKLTKIAKIDEENLYIFWNDMMNFNEIFRKNITYVDIKSQQKLGLHPFSRKHNFGKTRGGIYQSF